MGKKRYLFVKRVLVLGLIFVLVNALLPRTYHVPEATLSRDVAYWDLPTGSKIAYTHLPAQGLKKPYPILYLHGGPGGFVTSQHIQSLAPLAEAGYEVYLYDQLGSGKSERKAALGEYSAVRHTRDLEAIVKRIGAEKVILIGQSWGAILATLFLADNPTKVEQMILTGPGPIYPIREGLNTIRPPDSLGLIEPASSNKDANAQATNLRMELVRLLATRLFIKLASDQEADEYQTYLNEALNKSTVCDPSRALKAELGGGFYVQVMTLKSLPLVEDPRPKVKGLKTPVLILKGQCDNQPWGFVTEYQALLPNSRLKIIPGAGHAIAIEQADRYMQEIRDFLN